MQQNNSSQFDPFSGQNPFDVLDTKASIIGNVSGRSTDIGQIISSRQGAIVLAGAPTIGKSTLISYLQRPRGKGWSWRDELADFFDAHRLNTTHFVQIDLADLEGIEDKDASLNTFISLCAEALYTEYKQESPSNSMNLKSFVELLREISSHTPKARYFLMLDDIERLGKFGLSSFARPSVAQKPQEYGLALLDHSNSIRTIVDLISEFRVLGFILSIESLPRSKATEQFVHISADLTRFATITLQTFTWQDTAKLLAQKPADFGQQYVDAFEAMGSDCIFSSQEQQWLQQQAGTHPYLLQQLCFYAFHLKQEHMKFSGQWTDLADIDRQQLIDSINERLSTFFASTWNRLQEAMQSDPQARLRTLSDFQEFISLIERVSPEEIIPLEIWSSWGSEFRYILYSEGIVRYDPRQPIHVPGEFIRRYLVQKAHEIDTPLAPLPSPQTLSSGKGYWLTIMRGGQQDRLSLSELEYQLFKMLLQHPKNCTDNELIRAAWGDKPIDRSVFTQRMYHLRKKLRDRCKVEIIENRYGGLYMLNHPEWFQLE